MTNATKAQVLAVVNAAIGVLLAFHVILTQPQLGAIDIAVNAVLSLWVGLTYTQSSMRCPPV